MADKEFPTSCGSILHRRVTTWTEPPVAVTGDGANLISGRHDHSANLGISAAPPGIGKRWDCRCFTP